MVFIARPLVPPLRERGLRLAVVRFVGCPWLSSTLFPALNILAVFQVLSFPDGDSEIPLRDISLKIVQPAMFEKDNWKRASLIAWAYVSVRFNYYSYWNYKVDTDLHR